MRTSLIVCALIAVVVAAPAPAAAGKREPTVVVSTGRLVVLGDRQELREHLEKADKLLADSLRKAARRPLLEELLGNARNRLDNAREFLGFEREEEDAKAIQKEGREDDERLADAVVSQRLVVSDLDTLWWELGRADFNLSKAGAVADKPDLQGLVEQARGEVSLVRAALARMVDLGAPAGERPQPQAQPLPDKRGGGMALPTFPPPPQPMGEPTFQALLGALDREAFADDRLRVLETAAPALLFSVDQELEVLGRFPFSRHKLDAARLLRDRVAEKGGEFRLYSAFTFESDKEALKRILAGEKLEAVAPIDNDALDRLVAALKKGFATQIGHQILRDEAGRRWFVIDQVSRILGVFPTFDARLRALQILRPRVLDPEGWQKLEPLFATMEDRAQLRAQFVSGR